MTRHPVLEVSFALNKRRESFVAIVNKNRAVFVTSVENPPLPRSSSSQPVKTVEEICSHLEAEQTEGTVVDLGHGTIFVPDTRTVEAVSKLESKFLTQWGKVFYFQSFLIQSFSEKKCVQCPGIV